MNSKVRKIIHVIVDVLVVLVLIISILTLILALTSKANDGIPNIFGKSIIGVKTNSMHGDNSDSFNEGDLIFCDKLDDPLNREFKEGDVIVFRQDVDGNGEKSLVTHRIYKINEDGSFLTKGDNNDTYDQDPHNEVVFPKIYNVDVLAVYHGAKIPLVGYFINLLQTQEGFFWIILFPMIIFFIYQAIRVILNAMAYSKEKGAEQARLAVENADLTEEQKAKAIAEYLASQKAKEEQPEEEPAEPTAEESAEAAEEDTAEADGDNSEE